MYWLSTALLALLGSASVIATRRTPFARGGGGGNEQLVASAWYTNDLPLSDVSWSKFSTLIYSFANTTANPSVLSLLDKDKQLLPQFVQLAHDNGVEAHVAIGGWTGSRFFSSNAGNNQNRTQFIRAIEELINTYNLDGINFDWEYPGKQGIGCNALSPNDTANFLVLLQELREQVGWDFTLSAAVSLTPFVNASGGPSLDVSAFANVLDYIQIMNYDVSGPWSANFGSNSPLDDSCAPKSQQFGSATSAVKAWTAAGFPAGQIVLGVPSYGHSVSVNVSSALVVPPASSGSTQKILVPYPATNTSDHIVGDQYSGPAIINVCGVAQVAGDTWTFRGLVEDGLLTRNPTGLYTPVPGLYTFFDTCARTPFIYNATSQVMISYDDELSYFAKGQFIWDNGLRGFAMWETSDDYKDTLLDSILLSLGL